VNYELSIQIDSSDVNNVDVIDCFLAVEPGLRSKFSSYGIHMRDSIRTFVSFNSREEVMGVMMSLPRVRLFEYSVYKFYQEQRATITSRLGFKKTHVKYKEGIFPMKWDILPEEKYIGEYVCTKAQTHFAGRTYVAWFARDIPITEGPYKFGGLPGLILELRDTQNHYVFKFQSLLRPSAPLWLDVPDIYTTNIERSRVLKLEKEGSNNIRSKLQEVGLTPLQEDAYSVMEETAKSLNNYIERK